MITLNITIYSLDHSDDGQMIVLQKLKDLILNGETSGIVEEDDNCGSFIKTRTCNSLSVPYRD